MTTREFSRKEVELLKRTIAQDATDTELSMFIQNCKRYGLDPFTGQIHAVKRWDSNAGRKVMSVQVGIDGFRLIADRTGKWQGTKGPLWCGEDGQWTDVWLKDSYPAAAKVGVLRSDFSEPRWGIARWDAYVATKKSGDPTFMWQKMPAHMLAKCAEALALRSAFPNDLSGLYTDAEMDQAGEQDKRTYDGPDPDQVQDVEGELVSSAQDGKPDQWYEQATESLKEKVREGMDPTQILAYSDEAPTSHPIDDWPDEKSEPLIEWLKSGKATAGDSAPASKGQKSAPSETSQHQNSGAEKDKDTDGGSDPEEVKEAAESVEVEGEDANDEAFEDGDGLPF
jgi:phage recombination protein Bet